jgi:hypothetical protein
MNSWESETYEAYQKCQIYSLSAMQCNDITFVIVSQWLYVHWF